MDSIAPYFPKAQRIYPTIDFGHATDAVDVDTDGDVDILVMSTRPGTSTLSKLRIHRNLCTGDFFEAPDDADITLSTATSRNYRDFCIADFNLDGLPDVAAVASGGGLRATILVNDSGDYAPPFDNVTIPTSGADFRDMACADLDEDGDPDIIVLGTASGSINGEFVWILWNNWNGMTLSFTVDARELPSAPGPAALTPRHIACADFDLADGGDILIGGDFGVGTSWLYYNDGGASGGDHGTRFDIAGGPDETQSSLGNPLEVAAGRFNDDPDDEYPDIAWLSSAGVRVVLNDYPGNTATLNGSTSLYSGGQLETGMVVCDIDIDGFADVAVRNDLTEPIQRMSVFHNLTLPGESFGGLQQQSLFGHLPQPYDTARDIACADLNADGCIDIFGMTGGGIIATGQGRRDLMTWMADCSGGVRYQPIFPTGAAKPLVDVECGHFNGDGRRDIVVVNAIGSEVIILAQWPDESFPVEYRSPPVWPDRGVAAAVCDFDGEHFDDVAVIFDEGPTGRLRVLLSEDLPGSTSTDVSMSTSVDLEIATEPSDVRCGDVDGENGPDIVICDRITNGRVFVVYNDGLGRFRNEMDEYQFDVFDLPGGTSGDSVNPESVCLADFNQDGSLDIATANNGSDTVAILLNNGSGSFAPAVPGIHSVGNSPESIACGDLDGDAFPDIVTANRITEDVSVLINNGSGGGFATAVSYLVGRGPVAVVLCDLNADGLMDIATVDSSDRTLSVLLNNADDPGTFVVERRTAMMAGAGEFRAMTCCDLDANCRPELINTDIAHPDGVVRITYNLGIVEAFCGLPGDFNDDGMVNGCDIQDDYGGQTRGFVDTYFNPAEASLHDQCAADLTRDGIIDADDVACMIATLLGEACEPTGLDCETIHVEMSFSLGGFSESLVSVPTAVVRSPLIEDAIAWLNEHPRNSYPQITDEAWLEMCIEYFESIGMFE